MSEAQSNPFAPPTANLETEEPMAQSGSQLATRGQRFAAAFIDGLLQMMVLMPILFVSGLWGSMTDGTTMGLGATVAIGVGSSVLFLIFHGYFLMTRGQTIGKIAMKIRIVGEDGQLLPIGRLIGFRYLPFWIAANAPGVGSFINLIDVVFIFGEDRRCLHDRLAKTMVVLAD